MLFFMVRKLDALDVGRRLRRTRFALDKRKATDFAKSVGIEQSVLSMYETGDRFLSVPHAIRICEEYGLTLDWLYREIKTLLPDGVRQKLAEMEEPPAPKKRGSNPSPKRGADHPLSTKEQKKTA